MKLRTMKFAGDTSSYMIIDEQGRQVCGIWKDKTTSTDFTDTENKEMAKLIVTAINSCQEVNPDNPLAVAESIKGMYEALKGYVMLCGNTAYYVDQKGLNHFWNLAQKALNKVEGKE